VENGDKSVAATHGTAHTSLQWILNMGIIARYVRWLGHDAGGRLPPVDVLVGLLTEETGRQPAPSGSAADREMLDGEALVFVPPQWLGDWETGYALPPGYQYLWRAPRDRLQRLDGPPRSSPYRPPALPPAATGSAARRRRRPTSAARGGRG